MMWVFVGMLHADRAQVMLAWKDKKDKWYKYAHTPRSGLYASMKRC